MAKLNYFKPVFKIFPIPLDAAGTGGGCHISATNAQYVCSVYDPFTEDILFGSRDSGCEVIPLNPEDADACYFVPYNDMNIYNS